MCPGHSCRGLRDAGCSLASARTRSGWAFSYDLVKLKLVGTGERFLWRWVGVRFDVRLACSPVFEILLRLPVCHHDIVVSPHWSQDLCSDETVKLGDGPLSLLPSALKIF